MVLALIMVSVITGMTLVVFREDQREAQLKEAQAAAWHFTKVAKAARIYVRNNSILAVDVDADGILDVPADVNGDGVPDRIDGDNADTNADGVLDFRIGDGGAPNYAIANNRDGVWDDAFSIAALDADPDNIIPIPFAALIDDADILPGDAGLLPAGFPQTNIYGQTIQVFAAFYPLAGGPNRVPAAYVYLNPGPNPSPANMALLAQEAEKFDGFFNAPIFNNLAVNVSIDCDLDGNSNIVSWGGNVCADPNIIHLDSDDFAGIAAAGAGVFVSGALFAPAWRMAPHDTRALMRYEQQDNAVANLMTANMRFGNEEVFPLSGCQPIQTFTPDAMGAVIDINGNTYTQNASPLCQVVGDNNAVAGNQLNRDLRVNIENVASIENVTEIVLTNQTNDVEFDRYGVRTAGYVDETIVGSPTGEVLTIGNATTNLFGNLNTESDVHFTNRLGNPHPVGTFVPTVSLRNTGGILGDMQVDHTLELTDSGLSDLSISVTATATVDSVVTTQNISSNILEIDPTNAAGLMNAAAGSITDLIASPVGARDDGVIIGNNLTVGGTLQSNNMNVTDEIRTEDMTVTGTTLIGGNSVVTRDLNVNQNARFTDDVNVDRRSRVTATTRATGRTFIDNCIGGGCPDITE